MSTASLAQQLPNRAQESQYESMNNAGASRQTPEPSTEHQHSGMQMPEHQMSPSTSEQPLATEFASGTAWAPLATPHWAWMKDAGTWTLMVHANLFLTFDREGGARSVGKLESMNTAMFMEEHRLGRGRILFREMLSAEPLTAPHGGFPQLFQTGETYHGSPLVDRQHPHDLFGELSATYMLALRESIQWFVYGGPAAEPALGPVAYVHRASAMDFPQAPLGHHVQDSTHISYGVVTSGLIFGVPKRAAIQLEGSAFNGREPDEHRATIDLAALDSWAFRASARTRERWAMQYSIGHLVHPEAIEPGNLTRQIASVAYSRPLASGAWLTTALWGRNRKQFESSPQNSYLLESTLQHRRESLFTRLELVEKDELFPPEQTFPPSERATTLPLTGRQFRIGAYSFGAVHDFVRSSNWNIGLGADFSVYSKPRALDVVYGAHPVSFQVFVRARPSEMHMH